MLDSKIILTTNELVAAFLLCRYEKAAEDIINDQQLIQDEKDIEPFSIQAETRSWHPYWRSNWSWYWYNWIHNCGRSSKRMGRRCCRLDRR
ncbi:hypothetical protein DT075_03900 [Bacillus licheniformis]|nr:hypothetical protein DT075_03900 [Bacillus licheniformis]